MAVPYGTERLKKPSWGGMRGGQGVVCGPTSPMPPPRVPRRRLETPRLLRPPTSPATPRRPRIPRGSPYGPGSSCPCVPHVPPRPLCHPRPVLSHGSVSPTSLQSPVPLGDPATPMPPMSPAAPYPLRSPISPPPNPQTHLVEAIAEQGEQQQPQQHRQHHHPHRDPRAALSTRPLQPRHHLQPGETPVGSPHSITPQHPPSVTHGVTQSITNGATHSVTHGVTPWGHSTASPPNVIYGVTPQHPPQCHPWGHPVSSVG